MREVMKRGLIALAALVIAASPALAQQTAILIFGGNEHETFLGCLNCDKFSDSSVWNKFSDHGWENKFGQWSKYGDFKSKYSNTSACSPYATKPPVLVDRQGNSYGYLTVNKYQSGSVCASGGPQNICQALKVVCADE